METIRLFRALHKDETKKGFLKSFDFSLDSFMDEAYSHILESHTFKDNRGERVIFSFTTDIDIAINLLEEYGESYDSICYFDLAKSESAKICLKGVDAIVKPVFRFSDWVDMACFTKREFVSNLNFHGFSLEPMPILDALIERKMGALSKAAAMSEVAVSFKEKFFPEFLSLEKAREISKGNKQLSLTKKENLRLFSLSEENAKFDPLIKSLKNKAEKYNEKDKEFILENLKICEKVFL